MSYLWIKFVMHAFPKKILNPCQSSWNRTHTPWKSDLFNQQTKPLQKWDLKWLRTLIMLSVHGGIYLNVQDYKTKTENKMHVDIEYKCKKMAAVSLSTFSHLADRNGLAAYCLLFRWLKYCRNCSSAVNDTAYCILIDQNLCLILKSALSVKFVIF